MENTDKT